MLYGAAGLLVTAAVGFLVLERADKLKQGSVRKIGFVVGTFITVASILGIACVVSCKSGGGGWCPMKSKMSGKYYPMAGQSSENK